MDRIIREAIEIELHPNNMKMTSDLLGYTGHARSAALAPRLMGQYSLGSPGFPPTQPLPVLAIPLLPACLTFSTDPTLSSLLIFQVAYSPSLRSYIDACFRLVAQSAATSSRWFLARGLFYPEDRGDKFLRNVG
jgi:hypothetical protein